MCLLILQTPGAEIPPRVIRDSWGSNPDGAGFAYCADGRLHVERPFWAPHTLLEAYERARRAAPESPFVLHMRYRTHGQRSADNVHPFVVARGAVALAHNGMLDMPGGRRSWGDVRSDTAMLAASLRDARPDRLLSDAGVVKLERRIGGFNKVALVGADGRWAIAGEDLGCWEDGVWYSSRYYRYDRRFDDERAWSGFDACSRASKPAKPAKPAGLLCYAFDDGAPGDDEPETDMMRALWDKWSDDPRTSY